MFIYRDNTKSTTTVKTLPRCMPHMVISKTALAKMELFVDGCSDEIGWLGTATKSQNTITIDDVFLFNQEVHSTTTEITPEGLSEFAEYVLQQPNGMEIWNNLKVWGHSHVNMAVSPSGQDDKQMETFADGGHDWFIRIIANKKGDIRVDLYDYNAGIIYNTMSWETGLSQEEIDIQIQIDELQNMLDDLDDALLKSLRTNITNDIKEKVKKKSYYQTTLRNNNWRAPQVGNLYGMNTMMNNIYTENRMDTEDIEKKNIRIVSETSEEKSTSMINMLDLTTIVELGESISFAEAKEVIYTNGYDKQFTHRDVVQMWNEAQEYVSDIYSGYDK